MVAKKKSKGGIPKRITANFAKATKQGRKNQQKVSSLPAADAQDAQAASQKAILVSSVVFTNQNTLP